MMEERDEALGLNRAICWLSEQAEMWLDSVDRTMLIRSTSTGTRPHVSRAGRHRARGRRESLFGRSQSGGEDQDGPRRPIARSL
jgi:hypothetical protein